MLDTAIVGGGLCGMVLAGNLHRQGRSFLLFEARERLGGRILSVPCARSAMNVDLGPTWFWPDMHPLIVQLIADLGLTDFPQHDDGSLLSLSDPDKQPEFRRDGPVHGGARRLDGGMTRLIDALAAGLNPDWLRCNHVLTRVRDRGDRVELEFRCRTGPTTVTAHRAVLAIPPRLLDEQVRFEPDLDHAIREAMRETKTWMADRAKVVIGYDRPLWRDAGHAGNAFVSHGQAVIDEIYDACDGTATKAALGGFLALPPDLRDRFRAGLPLLMDNQMAQVFGPALESGAQHYQDWATEPFTCSRRDRDEPRADHPGFAHPLLRRPLWGGKLLLGGSETAAQGTGYLEGAVEAAMRVGRLSVPSAAAHGNTAATTRRDVVPVDADAVNAASLARFQAWVAAQHESVLNSYRHRLHRDLALQHRDQLTQRAILGTIEETYGKALAFLDELPFDTTGMAVTQGRSALTPLVQAPFGDVMKALVDGAIAFNQTSCALSSFPEEHRPSRDYLQAILRDIAAAWREFSLNANRLILAKAAPVHRAENADASMAAI